MSELERYDLVWDGKSWSIEPHFCREWEGEVGCYGTNSNHGYTKEEAELEIERMNLRDGPVPSNYLPFRKLCSDS